MSFLSELWNKLKGPHSTSKGSTQQLHESTSIFSTEPNLGSVLEAFHNTEEELDQTSLLITNLHVLTSLLNEPKEVALENRFKKITEHLGEPESHETLRQERWHGQIKCPNCQSTHLKRLVQVPPKSSHNHRYRCLNCGTEFNDDTGTPMEADVPSLNVWMQCWYLMGCTDSLSFIANKLNLDLATVERMVQLLKRTFQTEKPSSQIKALEDWKSQANILREHLKEDLLKQYERLDANVATVPKDTGEFRRQQHLRRNPLIGPKTSPSAGTSPDPRHPTRPPQGIKKK